MTGDAEPIASVDGPESHTRDATVSGRKNPPFCHSEAERGGGICSTTPHPVSSVLAPKRGLFASKKKGRGYPDTGCAYTAEEIEARMR
jgi:hypothetical protein